jgi:hypothetical protein
MSERKKSDFRAIGDAIDDYLDSAIEKMIADMDVFPSKIGDRPAIAISPDDDPPKMVDVEEMFLAVDPNWTDPDNFRKMAASFQRIADHMKKLAGDE